MPVACGLCERALSLEDEVNSGLQISSLCDDCKFLLLEDFGNPVHNSRQRRLPGRRSINGSSESTENYFSQQFSQIINLARHIELEHEDIDPNLRVLQPASSRSTPNGSRRWQRIISDTESDGFNSDSSYVDSESNVSFDAYRIYHGDSDAVSFSAYGGESDASIDGHMYLDTDIFVQSMERSERSDIDSDSDIDPMHAGIVQWNLDDHEDVEDGGWEEVDAGENMVGPLEVGAHIDTSGGSDPLTRRRTDSSEFEGIIRQRIREVRDLQIIPSIHMHVEESGEAPYNGNPGDYLDARGFEEFLEHIAESDSSRRGAPPAAASFVNSLPSIVISDEHQRSDGGLACAICKDLLMIGTEVKQLPCLHLYHPSCILPWLSARNSCPLCRYELPTDDIDYEQGKRNASRRMVITEIQQQDDSDDSASRITDSSEMNEAQQLVGALHTGSAADVSGTNGGRGGWLFLAAAPIVSLVGIVFVLWLGNPLAGGRGQTGQRNLYDQHSQNIHTSGLFPRNQQERRRWWF